MKVRSWVFFIVCVDFQSLVILVGDDHCLVAVVVIDVAEFVEGKKILSVYFSSMYPLLGSSES